MADMDFDRHPYMVIWEVTRSCALACRHCRAEAQPRRHPDELTTEEGLALIDSIERAGPKLLIFSGGDPMMRPDIFELIRHATAKRTMRVALSPSATPRLLKTDFHKIREAGIARMSLSIDGYDRESHDTFRGVPDTWDWTMEAVKKAKDAGIGLQINTTMTRMNFEHFDAFPKLLEWVEPVTWSVFMLVPMGRGKREDLLRGREIEDLFEKMAALSARVPYAIKTTEGQHYRRVSLQSRGLPPDSRDHSIIGLNDGKGFIFISHTGEVMPSGFLPLVGGDVRQGEVLDIYRDSPVFRELRDPASFKGKCGICEYHDICGGSRARAYAMTGDYLGPEPYCIYRPESLRAKYEQPLSP